MLKKNFWKVYIKEFFQKQGSFTGSTEYVACLYLLRLKRSIGQFIFAHLYFLFVPKLLLCFNRVHLLYRFLLVILLLNLSVLCYQPFCFTVIVESTVSLTHPPTCVYALMNIQRRFSDRPLQQLDWN